MLRNTRVLSVAIMVALAWLVPVDAQAAPIGAGTEIGVDFSNTNGAGTNYNLFNANGGIGAGSVTDTSGIVVDGVSLSLAGGDFFNGGAGSTAPSFPATVRNDFTGSSGWGQTVLTISGLDDSLHYDWVSSSSHTSGGRINRVTLTGLVGGPQSLDLPRTPGSEHSFYGIQPTAGTITATASETLAGNPILNGVKLTAVDPPPPIAVGTVIGMDFGSTNGAGTNYNLFPTNGAIGAGSVIDLSGAIVEGVSLTLEGGEFFNGNAGSAAPSFPDAAVRNDFTGAGGGAPDEVVLTIDGLDPSFLYDWVSTSSHTSTGRINRVTLEGLVGGSQFLDLPRDPTSEHIFTGIRPTAAGVITVRVTEILWNNPILNGARLEATQFVPEPSSFTLAAGLLGLGLGLCGWRRRK